MVKWARRLRGNTANRGRYHQGKGDSGYKKRGYDNDDYSYEDEDDYSDRSYSDKEEASWEDERDDVDGSFVDDNDELEEKEEYASARDDAEERDDQEEENELVTRNQVLGELRAQAAADALGKSLEQMGYNLDNCDSFYSLSDREGIDQRYAIKNRESEMSVGQKSEPKRRRSRPKKKKSIPKSPSSRYTVASDEEEEEGDSTLYGRSFGDYETYADDSSSEDFADDSYYEDETSFTSGRETAFTEKTSRFSRFTGKKSKRSHKFLKSSKAQKKRGRDNETYYTRGTEWTTGESSFGKTIDESSTLSSVSSFEDSELDVDTMYSEVTGKKRSQNRRNRKSHTRRNKRGMLAIEEEEPSEETLSQHSPPYERGTRKKKKPVQKKKAPPLRRTSSRLSSSSQIGAMRSFDSSSKDNSGDEDENAENHQRTDKEHNKGKARDGGKDKENERKKPKSSDPSGDLGEEQSQREAKHKRKSHLSDKKESTDSDAETSEDEDDAKARLKRKNRRNGEPKDGDKKKRSPRNYERGMDDDPSNHDTTPAETNQKSKVSSAKSRNRGTPENASHCSEIEAKEEARKEKVGKPSANIANVDKQGSGSRKDSGAKDTDCEQRISGKNKPKNSKSHDDQKKKKNLLKAAEDSRKESGTGSTKKFWPRQFLSIRKKRNQDAEEDTSKNPSASNADKMNAEEDTRNESDMEEDGNDSDMEEDGSRLEENQPEENRPRGQIRDRNASRERGSSRESRRRSLSPMISDRDDSSPARNHAERNRTKAAEKTLNSRSNEANDCQKPSSGDIFEAEENHNSGQKEAENPQSTSGNRSNILEMAALAAMIPLAPLAAAYSCYTAEATQSFMNNARTSCTDACNTTFPESKDKEVVDGDNQTRASRKSKSKQKKHDDSSVKTHEHSHKSTKSKKSVKSTRTEGKSVKSAKSKKSVKSTRTDGKSDKSIKSAAESLPARFLKEKQSNGGSSLLSRKTLGILPQREQKYKPPQTHIHEAPDGFESFLPGSLDAQCLNHSATMASLALSSLMSPSQQLPSSQQFHTDSNHLPGTKKKKNKWWMPKINFGGNKKNDDDDDDDDDNNVVYLVDPPKPDEVDLTKGLETSAKNNNPQGFAGPPKVPDKLPFLNKRKKNVGGKDNTSTAALLSYWTDAPTAASSKPGILMAEAKETGEAKHPLYREEGLQSFNCARPSGVCGEKTAAFNDDIDIDNSILSEFESLALDALRKKHREKSKSGEDKMASATQEDLFKYYDLGQTLSDVIDARQTLEHAYGLASGGGSFDHTIDEQLVELLTHMAEMDQDDVVEVEAAIKKLKKHARKLGISERDLLFSIKSAEESAMSLGGEEDVFSRNPEEEPKGLGYNMFDAFEGYFGRK